jgi:2-polyprenyl-3-methyl-5-hydroxy-6-metoxy-1,4-benzoquinol methylase
MTRPRYHKKYFWEVGKMLMWNRLKYVLSSQFDIYESISKLVRGRVADVGFGTGFGTHLFLVNSKEVFAYEIDSMAVQFAQRVFPMPTIQFKHGDIVKGIDDGPFDFVTMIDVLEHIEDDKTALLNIKKMMKKNASFILSTPNLLSRYRKSEDHIREYGPKDLERILKQTFVNVSLLNYKLELAMSKYENPMLAICRNEA